MICEECKLEVFINEKRGGPKRKYCSTICSQRAKHKRHYKKVGYIIYIDKICLNCNKEFNKCSRKEQKYCSKDCALIGRRKFIDIPDCLENASRKLDKNLGYVRVYAPMHPEANTWGYVYEHRIIAEKIIGRPLEKDEIVHHKNGKRWDNRKENLEVMDKKEHSKLRGQREEDLSI